MCYNISFHNNIVIINKRDKTLKNVLVKLNYLSSFPSSTHGPNIPVLQGPHYGTGIIQNDIHVNKLKIVRTSHTSCNNWQFYLCNFQVFPNGHFKSCIGFLVVICSCSFRICFQVKLSIKTVCTKVFIMFLNGYNPSIISNAAQIIITFYFLLHRATFKPLKSSPIANSNFWSRQR